jgi:hypothetical protein
MRCWYLECERVLLYDPPDRTLLSWPRAARMGTPRLSYYTASYQLSA